jgi:hypothetical protein
VRRNPYHNSAQLVLYPDHHRTNGPLPPSLKGVVEALADLLLAALGGQCLTTGGDDEHQDHA